MTGCVTLCKKILDKRDECYIQRGLFTETSCCFYWEDFVEMLQNAGVKYIEQECKYKKYLQFPNEKEKKGITELINTLSTLNNETSSDDIQAIVFAIGKKLEYENLREWFKGLYETVLGQSEGPRMGSFIKLYGIEPTKKLLENVILGNLVKE